MGSRIWVEVKESVHTGRDDGVIYTIPHHIYDCRVLGFKQFLPANKQLNREKHLVQLYTDPGGMRTLSVGSIRFKDPRRRKAI